MGGPDPMSVWFEPAAVRFVPDPMSVWFEPAAVRFVDEVAAARGAWHSRRVADPEPRHLAQLVMLGIDPFEPDTVGRTLDARDRWRRAFVRAVYREAKGGPPLEIEVGVKLPRRGVIPAGRPVRGRFLHGDAAAARVAEQRVTSGRIRRADPAERDWS